MPYVIRRAAAPPALDEAFDGPSWAAAEILEVGIVRTERGSDHHPQTRCKVLHTDRDLFVHFHVRDRYVKSTTTEYMGSVCRDSCVEFFVQPKVTKGYFNFEINAGGTLHVSYISDCRRTGGGFAEIARLPAGLGAQVRIVSSLPAVIDPELAEPTDWHLAYRVPLWLFEVYVGELGDLAGQCWRGNFYKCADATSHPHWMSWAPIGALNFHRPWDFAKIVLE